MQPPITPAIAPRWIVVAAIACVALPAAALAASSPAEPPTPALLQTGPGGEGSDILAPVDESVSLRVERVGLATRLTWKDDANWRARVFYRVYRYDGQGGHGLLPLRRGRVALLREGNSDRHHA